MRLKTLLTACLLVLGPVLTAGAQQGPFAPYATVNDRAITNFEVEQRVLFLRLLRSPGDPETEAPLRLIEDRLRLQAADALGIEVTEEQIMAGMTEFAARAQLSAEEFVKAIGQGGVAPETFRDFVTAGIAWREVVRAKFGPLAAVSEADIDRALSLVSQRGAVRVLLSEIILPSTPATAVASRDLARTLSETLGGEASFAAAARQYSASESAAQGGKLDWIPLTNLPPQVAPVVLSLSPGQISPPIAVPGAIALFQLRGIDEVANPSGEAVSLDYAQFLIPGGRTSAALAEAARIRAEIDTCDDLYGIAKGLPAEQLQRNVLPMSQVPSDIGLELAKIDEGESSTALVRGNALVFLMLCERRLASGQPPSRDAIRQQLINQQLNGYSDAYLAELMANAYIVNQ